MLWSKLELLVMGLNANGNYVKSLSMGEKDMEVFRNVFPEYKNLVIKGTWDLTFAREK